MQSQNEQPLRILAPGKRVCFWGAPSTGTTEGSLGQRLQATGANTGNMLIGHGLFHNLDAAAKAHHPGFGAIPPERLHEHFDTVFIPASNFISPSVDLTDQADYFARSKLPLVCFGLGSQILPGDDTPLKPGTDRFLRLVAERSGALGVRGSFTAEVLWNLGIRNVSVIGCPSLLNLRDAALQRLATTRATLDKLVVGFSNNVRRHAIVPDAMRVSENALFQRLLGENAYYVLQNEIPELQLMAAMEEGDADGVTAAAERVAAAFGVSPSRADFRRFLETRMRVFFSVEAWMGCTATMSAAIGSRFHGNIAALLSGTPALFLVHDMRTLELCELLRVPHMALDRARSADEIMQQVLAMDYTPFLRQVPRLRMEWRLFLARNGLEAAAVPALPVAANEELEPALSA